MNSALTEEAVSAITSNQDLIDEFALTPLPVEQSKLIGQYHFVYGGSNREYNSGHI